MARTGNRWLTGMGRVAALLVALGGCSAVDSEASTAAGPGTSGGIGGGGTAVARAPRAPAAAEAHSELSFPQWLAALKAEAREQGISARVLDQAFKDVRLSERVMELDNSQPEFSRPVWAYLDSAASANRVREGRDKRQAHAAVLDRVGREYRVPPEIIVAFWGIESDYGREYGDFPVIDAVTTLAFKSRRAAYFRGELLAALRILQNGDIAREQMRGSWAGAMGHTQFMPTVFLEHAVDYDHDGRRDIWNSLPDVFASTGHFVAGLGWRPGERWGEEVRLPADFPWEEAELTVQKPVAAWRALGVKPAAGGALTGEGSAAILLPAGHTGPAFLLRDNFRVIMGYNPSTSYALAVALLADRMAGAGPLLGTWPRHEAALSRSERVELQERLAALGLNPGKADSLIGPATRNALRAFQKSQHLIPDGFATRALLDRVRGVAR